MKGSTALTAAKRMLKTLDRALGGLESFMLIVIGLALLGLSALRIGLRFFGAGMPWIAPCLRSLVLWTAFFGGAKAVERNASVRIDLLERFFSPGVRRAIVRFRSFIAALLCLFMVWIAWRFVMAEKAFGEVAFWKVKTWHVETVFPAGLALMAFHFTVRVLFPERTDP